MRILLPLDGSRTAECALAHGRALGQTFGADSVLLHVVATGQAESGPATHVLDWQLRRRHAEAYLAEVRSNFGAAERRIDTAVVEGRAAEEVMRYAHAHDIDLVVMTDSGEGGTDPGRLGGTAGKVIAGLNASLLLVPQADPKRIDTGQVYRLVLAPVDGSPGSGWAARIAAAIAMSNRSTLMLMRVVQAAQLPGSARHSRELRLLAERVTQAASLEASQSLRQLRTQLPPDLAVETRVVVAPNVCRAIKEMAEARQADLLVMSARGLDHEVDWRYGSVAERLLVHAACPLLVLQHRSGAVAGAPLPGESGRWRMPSVA